MKRLIILTISLMFSAGLFAQNQNIDELKRIQLNKSLLDAADNGNLDRVKFLIEKENGADVNTKNESGWTALIYAAVGGHTQIAKFLIEKDANVNAKDNAGFTALMFASGEGHIEIVKMLLDNDADVNAVDKSGGTAFMYANYWKHGEIVNLLKEKMREEKK